MSTEVRQVDVADALDWLPAHAGQGAITTSPPDASELPDLAGAYDAWLADVVHLVLDASTGPTVLVLTDRKRAGVWQDKVGIVLREAQARGLPLLWHRIALRRRVGAIDLHVPTYSHVLAIGPGRPGRARPDVLDQGPAWWAHGVGWDLARYVAEYLREQGATTAMDPFAGTGAFLVAAELAGMRALGCELHPGRAEQARSEPSGVLTRAGA